MRRRRGRTERGTWSLGVVRVQEAGQVARACRTSRGKYLVVVVDANKKWRESLGVSG